MFGKLRRKAQNGRGKVVEKRKKFTSVDPSTVSTVSLDIGNRPLVIESEFRQILRFLAGPIVHWYGFRIRNW